MYPDSVDTTLHPTQFDKAALWMEFKPDDTYDPFIDEGQTFLRHSKQRDSCRGQLVSYATELCSRQHRLFAFSIFLGDPWVRLIFWDRAGAVVTERFNFREDGNPLAEFFWRFAHLSDEDRGMDPTVSLATAEEANIAKEKLSRWKNAQERPVYKFLVPDNNNGMREFLAWGSMANADSMIGRATRAYPVYEVATDKVMFMKDAWRSLENGMLKESDTLMLLNEKGVRYVPQICLRR